jgi:Reverse transcriptase (RNA-dependent DNA polymerase)
MYTVRVLISLYTANQVIVLWAGLASDSFKAQNGVKQGGVRSPILFCIYIDGLLIKLSLLGVGCFIGFNFTGALAYADDIVLFAPNPSAMRKPLAICDAYMLQNIILSLMLISQTFW